MVTVERIDVQIKINCLGNIYTYIILSWLSGIVSGRYRSIFAFFAFFHKDHVNIESKKKKKNSWLLYKQPVSSIWGRNLYAKDRI